MVRSSAPRIAVAATIAIAASRWGVWLRDCSSLSSAAALGSHWGRVTSTYRSPEHNREVGGVPNSYHLLGRAIDIARSAGVNHAMIKAAYQRAGYTLVESLDEGDHSHFAFSWGAPRVASFRPTEKAEATQFRIVYAPAGGN